MAKWFQLLRRGLLTVAVSGLSVLATTGSLSADDTLTIGSQAPALDIEHWVHNGNGRFKPVNEFVKGKVYVVEFWATWCGPCIASMPHLVELQEKFSDKGVQVISISDEDLETVEKFLERPVRGGGKDKETESGDKPKTYRELTSAYCLTTDPDGSSNDSYMKAAGQNGIPCAFVVGKDQKIEWIGHPMSMDEVLEKVVEGKWDRAAFAEEFAEQQKLEILMAKANRAARGGKLDDAIALLDEAAESAKSDAAKQQMTMMKVQFLAQNGKSAEALEALDGIIAGLKSDEAKKRMKMMRIQVVLQDSGNKQFSESLTQAYVDFKDNPSFVNFMAWTVYEKFAAGELEDKTLLKASRAAAEQAAADADESSKAAILDTAAHLQFLDGDKAAAIKTQENAVELASPEMKKDLAAFLNELKEDSK
jgi:thiol-disulfide isomerase/thioredoxin